MYANKAPEVEASLHYIQDHIFDPLSLGKIAHEAGYSPYHFTRIFKAHMGISLFYYVSSLRLQKAKDLLLHTELTIRDIALEVGQQSLGTFTTRFTQKVGVSPAVFRKTAKEAEKALETIKRLEEAKTDNEPSGDQCSMHGTIEAEIPYEGIVLIGLFPKPIPEGIPLHGTLVKLPGRFCFSGVRPGVYYLMGTSVSWGMRAESILLTQKNLRTRNHQPLEISPEKNTVPLKVKLHLPQLDDPPILVSLPFLMNRFLRQKKQMG